MDVLKRLNIAKIGDTNLLLKLMIFIIQQH